MRLFRYGLTHISLLVGLKTGFVKEDGFGSREGRQGRFIKDDASKYPDKVSVYAKTTFGQVYMKH